MGGNSLTGQDFTVLPYLQYYLGVLTAGKFVWVSVLIVAGAFMEIAGEVSSVKLSGRRSELPSCYLGAS